MTHKVATDLGRLSGTTLRFLAGLSTGRPMKHLHFPGQRRQWRKDPDWQVQGQCDNSHGKRMGFAAQFSGSTASGLVAELPS